MSDELRAQKREIEDANVHVSGEIEARKSTKRPRRKRTKHDNFLEEKGLSFTDVSKTTTLERFRRKRATETLRDALARHQPVVKRVVAERLCRHSSYEALARQYFLTAEQVADILRKMRPWVARFTTYFESDWYWVEGGAPTLNLPEPSQN